MNFLIIVFGVAAIALTIFQQRRTDRIDTENKRLEAENASLRVALELAQRGEE